MTKQLISVPVVVKKNFLYLFKICKKLDILEIRDIVDSVCQRKSFI